MEQSSDEQDEFDIVDIVKQEPVVSPSGNTNIEKKRTIRGLEQIILQDPSKQGAAMLAFRSKSDKKKTKLKDILGPDTSIKSIANSDPNLMSDDENFKYLKKLYYNEKRNNSKVRKEKVLNDEFKNFGMLPSHF